MSKTLRAIIKKPHEFRAVQMRPSGTGYELLSYCDNEADLPSADSTVIGFDSSRAAFYHIMVPPVREEQMPNLVRMQAETLLPLPLEQMELAWRQGVEKEGKVAVTITAARSLQLEKFFQGVQDYNPSKIMLDCEAVIKAWQGFYAGGLEFAVVVYLGESSTHVCLTQNGALSHAVTLELGRNDLVGAQPEHTNLQRFSHDLQNALQLFDLKSEQQIPIYLLCPDLQSYQNFTRHLSQMELNIQAALPSRDQLTCSGTFSAEKFYEYLVPLGLALMGLDAESKELKLFRRILPEKDVQQIGLALPPLKVSAIFTAVMLIVFGGAFFLHMYAWESKLDENLLLINDFGVGQAEITLEQNGDKANVEPVEITREQKIQNAKKRLNEITREQNIKKVIAQDRINLLTLIEKISGCAPTGVELDKFIYQKGRQITVEGQANRQQLIYSFTGNLKLQPVFRQVIIQNQNPESQGNRTNFTVKFDYTEAPK